MRGNYQVRFCGGRGAVMLFSPTQQHYDAQGAAKYLGFPKKPTLTVNQFVDGVYKEQRFRGSDRVISRIFPALTVTAEQILNVGQ